MEKRKPHGVEYTRELKSLRKKIISTGFILWKDVRGAITPEETIPHTSLLSKADINTSFHSKSHVHILHYLQSQPALVSYNPASYCMTNFSNSLDIPTLIE